MFKFILITSTEKAWRLRKKSNLRLSITLPNPEFRRQKLKTSSISLNLLSASPQKKFISLKMKKVTLSISKTSKSTSQKRISTKMQPYLSSPKKSQMNVLKMKQNITLKQPKPETLSFIFVSEKMSTILGPL